MEVSTRTLEKAVQEKKEKAEKEKKKKGEKEKAIVDALKEHQITRRAVPQNGKQSRKRTKRGTPSPRPICCPPPPHRRRHHPR